MLTLFHAPGACSMGLVFLLEELGVDYQLAPVDLRTGAQHSPEFRQTNPKGKVPALRLDDGAVLTEFQAIACWLCRAHGAPGLWPESAMAEARLLERLDFIVGSIHARGFTFLAMPQKFTADPGAQDALRALGRREIETGFATLAAQWEAVPRTPDRIGPDDAALFYVFVWARALGLALPGPLAAHADALLARPAARVAMQGLADH